MRTEHQLSFQRQTEEYAHRCGWAKDGMWYTKTPKDEEVREERADLGVGVQEILGREVRVHRGKGMEWETPATPFVLHCHVTIKRHC